MQNIYLLGWLIQPLPSNTLVVYNPNSFPNLLLFAAACTLSPYLSQLDFSKLKFPRLLFLPRQVRIASTLQALPSLSNSTCQPLFPPFAPLLSPLPLNGSFSSCDPYSFM